MRTIKQFAAAAMLVSAAFITSCKTTDDTNIESDVSKAVNNDEVHVVVKERKVTLTGKVKDDAEKARMEAEVRAVKGVEAVENDLTVVLPPPPPAPPTPAEVASASASIADTKLNGEVQAVIAPFPDVRASVDNGVVTLTGEISKPGLALMMPRIAGLFPRKIENKLTIK